MYIPAIEARESLKHITDELRMIVQNGWNDYIEKYPPSVRLVHCATTRAGIVHDHQVERAAIFALKNKHLGVQPVNLSRLHLLVVSQKFAIRFKKLNADKKSSNQPTKQVKEFLSQESLTGVENITNLEVGYVLSNDEQEITNIYMVCPNGTKSKPFWSIELLETGNETIVTGLFDDVEREHIEDDVAIIPRAKPAAPNVVKLNKADDENQS